MDSETIQRIEKVARRLVDPRGGLAHEKPVVLTEPIDGGARQKATIVWRWLNRYAIADTEEASLAALLRRITTLLVQQHEADENVLVEIDPSLIEQENGV